MGKAGSRETGDTANSFIWVRNGGSLVVDAGLTRPPVSDLPVLSDGTVTVHCGKDANSNATGGLMLSGGNTYTNNYSLDIFNGTLTLDNDPTDTGNGLWATSGLRLDGGTLTLSTGGFAYLNSGSFYMAGGTLTVGGAANETFSIGGDFLVTGGTINMGLSGINPDGVEPCDQIGVAGAVGISGGVLNLTLVDMYPSYGPSAWWLIQASSGDDFGFNSVNTPPLIDYGHDPGFFSATYEPFQ